MRIGRFTDGRYSGYGVIEGDIIYEMENPFLERFNLGRRHTLGDVSLLPPTVPTKIIAIGLNYKAHAAEFNKMLPDDPMIFMKPPSALIGNFGRILYPFHMSHRVDFEGELGVVVGRAAYMVEEDNAEEYILGYTCFNDITARDLQKRDIQFVRSKGFDTFAPAGPWVETDIDPLDTRIETYLNNEKMQDSRTSDMIFNVYQLVSFVSHVMTLMPGDLIATGTPSGVGKMKPGDTVEVRIEGIGSLVNRVESIQ